jgi:hypothetical protein
MINNLNYLIHGLLVFLIVDNSVQARFQSSFAYQISFILIDCQFLHSFWIPAPGFYSINYYLFLPVVLTKLNSFHEDFYNLNQLN